MVSATWYLLYFLDNHKKVQTFYWGGFAPPDPPFKSAAVAASASQVRTLKQSQPLSRPPWVGSTWTWTGPGTRREALGPGLGLAGGPGWRPWPEAQARGPYFFFSHEKKKKRAFLFSRLFLFSEGVRSQIGMRGGRLPPSENKKPGFFFS